MGELNSHSSLLNEAQKINGKGKYEEYIWKPTNKYIYHFDLYKNNHMLKQQPFSS